MTTDRPWLRFYGSVPATIDYPRVTLYEALEKDIRRAFASLHGAVEKATKVRFPHSALHQEVAKTVAVLQILGNLPISRQNIGSLMHGSIAGAAQAVMVA